MTRRTAITASRNTLFASVALVALSTAAMADPLIDGEDLSGFTTNDLVNLTDIKAGTTVSGTGNMYLAEDGSGDVFFSFNQPTSLNNNGYGSTAVGGLGGTDLTDPQYNWDSTANKNAGGPGKHSLSDLLGSDQAEFVFYDSKGNAVFDFLFDYASASGSTVITDGDTGGDGKVITGTASWLSKYATSLSYDCALAGSSSYCGSGANSPTPTQLAKWVNQIIYQGEISHLAFGASGFGGVAVTLIHDSPAEDSKDIQFETCLVGSGGSGVLGTCGMTPGGSVPEPNSLSLLVGGFLSLLLFRFSALRRRLVPGSASFGFAPASERRQTGGLLSLLPRLQAWWRKV